MTRQLMNTQPVEPTGDTFLSTTSCCVLPAVSQSKLRIGRDKMDRRVIWQNDTHVRPAAECWTNWHILKAGETGIAWSFKGTYVIVRSAGSGHTIDEIKNDWSRTTCKNLNSPCLPENYCTAPNTFCSPEHVRVRLVFRSADTAANTSTASNSLSTGDKKSPAAKFQNCRFEVFFTRVVVGDCCVWNRRPRNSTNLQFVVWLTQRL